MVEIKTEDYLDMDEGEQIFLDEISCVYIQSPDCTESREDDPQQIILSTRDGGGGKFININTTNWSICGDGKDFLTLIDDFKQRAGITDNE